MCIVSEKLKCCSCATTNVQSLENYWVWHQYNKDKCIIIVGEIYIPNFIVDTYKKINKNTILNRLTEADVFDKQLVFRNKDVLEIVLNNHSEKERKIYCFQFKNDSWESKTYHPFEIESQYDEKEKGKITNAIIRK